MKHWLSRDQWALKDACQIVYGEDPRVGDKDKKAEWFEFRRHPVAITHEMAVGFFESTNPGWAVWSDRMNDFVVEVRSFVVWAAERNRVEVPFLLEALKIPLPDGGAEIAPPDVYPHLAKGARYRERCQALALLFWEREPELQPGQIAKKPEMISIGCDGVPYKPDTITGWIKDLSPVESKKGRPPNPKPE